MLPKRTTPQSVRDKHFQHPAVVAVLFSNIDTTGGRRDDKITGASSLRELYNRPRFILL